jgi:signal transduction histidine kinase
MVKEVVQAHSGKVDVVSSAGDGSTFTVRLPLGAPADRSAA